MSDKLYKLIPHIKRARDFYLYDEKGNRYLDLYLDNGRAINGHRPAGLSLALKNTLSRGLYAPYPSKYTGRLIKLLQREFPRLKYLGIYRSIESFREKAPLLSDFADPAEEACSSTSIFWRPYLDIGDNYSLLKISFPFPGCDVIAVLSDDESVLPRSDFIPPYILSGVIRSWFDWKANSEKDQHENWDILDRTGHWKRTGPYLKPLCSREEYEHLFKFYLEKGILISPDYNHLSISAVDIKEGSLKKLYNNLRGNEE